MSAVLSMAGRIAPKSGDTGQKERLYRPVEDRSGSLRQSAPEVAVSPAEEVGRRVSFPRLDPKRPAVWMPRRWWTLRWGGEGISVYFSESNLRMIYKSRGVLAERSAEPLGLTASEAPPRGGRHRAVVSVTQLRTVDHSARRSMKNAANCAKHGELQGFMKPLHVERILRPRLPGRGHTHLRVGEKNFSRPLPSTFGETGAGAFVHWPARVRRLWAETRARDADSRAVGLTGRAGEFEKTSWSRTTSELLRRGVGNPDVHRPTGSAVGREPFSSWRVGGAV